MKKLSSSAMMTKFTPIPVTCSENRPGALPCGGSGNGTCA